MSSVTDNVRISMFGNGTTNGHLEAATHLEADSAVRGTTFEDSAIRGGRIKQGGITDGACTPRAIIVADDIMAHETANRSLDDIDQDATLSDPGVDTAQEPHDDLTPASTYATVLEDQLSHPTCQADDCSDIAGLIQMELDKLTGDDPDINSDDFTQPKISQVHDVMEDDANAELFVAQGDQEARDSCNMRAASPAPENASELSNAEWEHELLPSLQHGTSNLDDTAMSDGTDSGQVATKLTESGDNDLLRSPNDDFDQMSSSRREHPDKTGGECAGTSCGSPVTKEEQDEALSKGWSNTFDNPIDLDMNDSELQMGPRGGNSSENDGGMSSIGIGVPEPRRRQHFNLKEVNSYQSRISRQTLSNDKGETDLTNGSVAKEFDRSGNEEHGSEWMGRVYDYRDDALRTWKDANKAYQDKVANGENTEYDDREHMAAAHDENLRVKRLEQEFCRATGRTMVNEEPSDAASFTRHPQKRKRDIDHRASTGRKPTYTKFKENEAERVNMLAGIARYLQKFKEKQDAKDSTNDAEDEVQGKESSKQTAKKKGNGRTTRTQLGFLNNLDSLWNFSMSTAGSEKKLPAMPECPDENQKLAFLNSLVVGLPPQHIGRQQKNHVFKSTSILRPRGVIPSEDGSTWKVSGMRTTLKHHQVQGAAFMVARENGTAQPLGGIVADVMGMGKTVQAIALMVCNRANEKDPHQATLVVTTSGLVDQWYDEIVKHLDVGAFQTVTRYCRAQRVRDMGSVGQLEKSDVVITSYNEVARSYPEMEPPPKFKTEEELCNWWSSIWRERRGILHQAKFHRIILDESQAIKNHLSQQSIACRALMAQYRWALSGTPVMNSCDEFYAYFRFFRMDRTDSLEQFREYYTADSDEDCGKRMKVVLKAIMIRRTVKDELFGARILELPEMISRDIRLEFSKTEKIIYEHVRQYLVEAINGTIAEKGIAKARCEAMTGFQRLRQMSAHILHAPVLLRETVQMKDVEVWEADLGLPDDENKNDHDILGALRRIIMARHECPESSESGNEIPLETVKDSKLIGAFNKKMRKLWKEDDLIGFEENAVCQSCRSGPFTPFVTSCYHLYCKVCLEEIFFQGANENSKHACCKTCGQAFNSSEAIEHAAEILAKIRDGEDQNNVKKENIMQWIRNDNSLVLSTKVVAVTSRIQQWLTERPQDKIIVFSQFKLILKVMEEICRSKGWRCCKYNGDMSIAARDKELKKFAGSKARSQILLASLMCGGLGLNLTMACKVISFDLWYNIAVEEQVSGRVHRIGQTRDVAVERVIIEDSVDERLEVMQKSKQNRINDAMDDKVLAASLDVEEIVRLFGDVQHDSRTNRPHIVQPQKRKRRSGTKKN